MYSLAPIHSDVIAQTKALINQGLCYWWSIRTYFGKRLHGTGMKPLKTRTEPTVIG